eukprot:scaffold78647_cov49-Attheya_sp.AAC.2
MAAVAFRSALGRCGLSRAAIHAVLAEGYADTDALDLVTQETLHSLVKTFPTRIKIIIPHPNPNHVEPRSGAIHIPWNNENKLHAFHH